MRHIRDGKLRFINVSTGKRKRYRFTQKNLLSFIENQKTRDQPKCPSISPKTARRRSISSTSRSMVVAFTALPKPEPKKKPKP
ncbi:hypothetical protein [Variibacter gotjawalensis]